MVDFPKYAPRGYKPFEIEYEDETGWICATPHCDDPVQLVEGIWVEHPDGAARDGGRKLIHFSHYSVHGPIAYYSRERIPAFFDTEEEAIEACWKHAKHWWSGEPPSTWAIPLWANRLPPGYRIFVQVDEGHVWLVQPDGTRKGPVELLTDLDAHERRTRDLRLSVAIEHFREDAFREMGKQAYAEQKIQERERIKAWAGEEPPRDWSFQYSDDGDFYSGVPAGHCAEMRVYLPFEMIEDVKAILRYGDGPSLAIHGHFREWLDTAIREHAKIALAKLEENDDGEA